MKLSTSLFTFVKSSQEFVTEMSDLPSPNVYHRLYPDACDVGITLISEKTNQEATYCHSEDVYTDDEDHEFTHAILLPTLETIRKYPRLKNTKVVLIND
jgi:hypothetical protein